MSEQSVSSAERLGAVILTATVGALVTTLIAHPLIESSLGGAWVEAGGDSAAVSFKAQEAFVTSGETAIEKLEALPLTKIHLPLTEIQSAK